MRSISRRDAIGAAVLTAAGVGLRLLFGAAFPTEPVSDFRGLVLFGLRLREEGFAVAGWHWVQFSPGLPLLLSVLFRVFPRNVAAVARISTEVATGLVPLLPYWIWSRVVGWRWRFLAGLLLALWPGLVFFSGVAAQENWALLPVVALAALAVRRLRDPREGGRPLTAGLLYFAAAAIRQEMLVVMAPVAIAAAGLPGRPRGRAARLLRLGAAAAVPLLALAGERFAATGRFSITTEHGGLGALGTVAPGSSAVGWTDPTLYAASIDPGLLEDPRRLRREAWRLAWEEARRRYRYHAFRSAVLALRLSVRSEADAAFWSLEAPGALPPDRAAAGGTWARAATPFLEIELALLSGLFLAAAFRGLRRRDAAILVLAAAVLLKLLVQVLFSPLGRLTIPAIALALLAAVLGIEDLAATGTRIERAGFPAASVLIAALLLVLSPPLDRLVVRKDEPSPAVSRFPLAVAGGNGFARCVVEQGRVSALSGDRAWIGARESSGRARVVCRLPPLSDQTRVGLDLASPPESGERIEADGRPQSGRLPLTADGWRRVPLTGRAGPPAEVALETAPGGTLGFGFVRTDPGARPLPRYFALP